jgi:zinc protease
MHRLAPAWSGLLLAGLLWAAPASAQAADWTPETFTLSNGMQAVVLPDHRSPVVTHMIWYRVGSADEAKGKSGLAHFLEHLMYKSTDSMSAGDFARIVARNGGHLNAATSYDWTHYHFRIAKDRLPQMMRMEADRMVNLELGEDEVAAERRVVQEERRQTVESNPSAVLDEMIWSKLYPGHPYAVPVIGHMDEVAALSRIDAIDWYKRWYGPENAILVVAGDITARELKPLAESIYGATPARGAPHALDLPPVKPLAASATLVHKDPKIRQLTWSRTWQGVPVTDPDAAALQVAMQVLGGGRTSRLYRQLVEGGQAVTAYAWAADMEGPGPITVSASPSADASMEDVQRAAIAIVDDLIKTGPTQEELDRARNRIAASAIFRRDNQMELANWYGGLLVAGMSLDQIEAMDDRIAAVTAADVQRVLKRLLSGVHHIDGVLLPEAP